MQKIDRVFQECDQSRSKRHWGESEVFFHLDARFFDFFPFPDALVQSVSAFPVRAAAVKRNCAG
jgi:hypothetical protein